MIYFQVSHLAFTEHNTEPIHGQSQGTAYLIASLQQTIENKSDHLQEKLKWTKIARRPSPSIQLLFLFFFYSTSWHIKVL